MSRVYNDRIYALSLAARYGNADEYLLSVLSLFRRSIVSEEDV